MPQPTLEELRAKLGTNALPAAYRGDPPLRGNAPSREPGQTGRETLKARETRRIAQGIHPTGIAAIATAPPAQGQTCGTCAHRVCAPSMAGYRYFKCELNKANWTASRTTDVLRKWPACERWEPMGETNTTQEG